MNYNNGQVYQPKAEPDVKVKVERREPSNVRHMLFEILLITLLLVAIILVIAFGVRIVLDIFNVFPDLSKPDAVWV